MKANQRLTETGWVLFGFLAVSALGNLNSNGAPAEPASPWIAKERVPLRAAPFGLTEVRLLEGPFKHAMELDRQYLLSLDTDRLLHTFRLNAGLPSTAKPYGGWEEPKCELRGHFTGHYLSACALMYASTGDARLTEKAGSVVAELAKCQAALRSGYLSAYPEEFIERVEAQRRVWAPYYTLHKILAGLLDVYVHCGNPQALEVARKFGDWVIARNSRLTDPQMQAMLGNEHGGMNEALANLYALTGAEQYLQVSLRFNHLAVVGPAAKLEDKLTGLHANTQIPKFIGTARQYELAGEEWLRAASRFFWDTVVKERSYVIGGHSDGEMFSPKERLSQALGPNTTETCNTYNMLKLTRHLFGWDPRAEYADYYERALYNHILASQNPDTGMTCYYVPLRSGSRKQYCTPADSFWCCTGTGVENHAKYGDSIYFHDGGRTLWVNLLIASELDWKSQGLKLRQETRYPEEAAAKLVFACRQPVQLNLTLRHPSWAVLGMELTVNGKRQVTDSKPGSFASVSREWKDGDVVEVSLPMSVRAEGFRDNPRRLAVLHGPLVLSAEIDTRLPVPAIVGTPAELVLGLKPAPGKPSTFTSLAQMFRIPGVGPATNLTLEPFYQMHGNRHYAVYWDVFTPEEWQAKEDENRAEAARQKELAARTVDSVNPGEEQNERDHKLQGEKTAAGEFGGRNWRHATDGGWFSYQLKVLPDQSLDLSVTYWGGDAGNRVFDLLVDGVKVATQRLQNNRPGKFYEEVYRLPEERTEGKHQVILRFQAAAPDSWVGGVFGCRVLKR
jgi:DUF1680 family protein